MWSEESRTRPNGKNGPVKTDVGCVRGQRDGLDNYSELIKRSTRFRR